jgi:hypothetical protein
MCTVLLPPGVNPIAVNKYIISSENLDIRRSSYQKIWISKIPDIRISDVRRSRYQNVGIADVPGKRSSVLQKVWISDSPGIRIFGYQKVQIFGT